MNRTHITRTAKEEFLIAVCNIPAYEVQTMTLKEVNVYISENREDFDRYFNLTGDMPEYGDRMNEEKKRI